MARIYDEKWQQIFDKYNIAKKVKEHGVYRISTEQIKEFREPRLMTKFDHSNNEPKVFRKHNISILPDSRYGYILGNFNLYKKITYDRKTRPISMSMPHDIESIKRENLTSEAISLHAAHITGMLNDFTGEESIQTVSGRMTTNEMDFDVRNINGSIYNFEVVGSQVEIDGGYESKSYISLVEAKQHEADDFLIRQLYYPFRVFYNRGLNKRIKNIYMTYSGDIYTFFEYDFLDPMQYNSLVLIKQKSYKIGFDRITKDDLLKIHKTTKLVEEPNINAVPFPQANSFERIIDFLTILTEKDLNFEEMTSNYDFDPRQSDYYKNSAKYLGLIDEYLNENKVKTFTLNDRGRQIMGSSPRDKYLEILKLIFSHKPFNDLFSEHIRREPNNFNNIDSLSDIEVGEIIAKSVKGYSDSTYKRRGSSSKSWFRWIFTTLKKFK